MTGLQPVLDWLAQSVWLQVGAVLAATVIAAFLTEWIFRAVIGRIAARTATRIDDEIGDTVHPAARNTVLLIGAGAALQVAPVPEAVRVVVLALLKTGILLLWTVTVATAASLLIRHFGGQSRYRIIEPRTVPLFDTTQKIVVFGAAIYVGFLIWSIDVTAWLASAGIIGIAVGFAAKDTIANLFAGISILIDSPYKVGDMVVFENGDRGEVREVGIRSTRILTRNDVEIIVPNSVIGTGRVTNESGGGQPKRRVDVRVGVSYASDIDRVREILLEVAESLDVAANDPAPRVRFREMADSALVFSLLFWIEMPQERGLAIDLANTTIFKRFAAEGVEIPFPQRVVHHVGALPAAGGVS